MVQIQEGNLFKVEWLVLLDILWTLGVGIIFKANTSDEDIISQKIVLNENMR